MKNNIDRNGSNHSAKPRFFTAHVVKGDPLELHSFGCDLDELLKKYSSLYLVFSKTNMTMLWITDIKPDKFFDERDSYVSRHQ